MRCGPAHCSWPAAVSGSTALNLRRRRPSAARAPSLYETPAAGDTRALEAAARLLQRVRQRAGQDEDQLVVAVPDLRAHLGLIADRFFGQPSQALQVIGVTGTNGKTTCAWLIAQALSLCGRPAAYIGTLGYGATGALQPVAHTTSDVVSVHRQLAVCARRAPRPWRWRCPRMRWTRDASMKCALQRPRSPI